MQEKFSRKRKLTGSRSRSEHGGSIVEAGASIALLLPILILLMMFVVQLSVYFIIKQQLTCIARMVAHECANAYGKLNMHGINTGGTSSGVGNVNDTNYQEIVGIGANPGVSCPGVFLINGSANIQTNFWIPNSPNMDGAYVVARVSYANGAGLPKFPFNPLSGNWAVLDFTGVTVRSSCSWPIPN